MAPALKLLALGLGGCLAAAAAGNATANVTTTPAPAYHADSSPAGCTPGKSCTNGGMPAERGMCVMDASGAGAACWDVCNPAHSPGQYRVSTNPVVTMTYKGMVETVRSGLNPIVNCPGMKGGDPCPPGFQCPAEILSQSRVPKGQGLCVIDPNAPMSRACWDMCDFTKSVRRYTVGTAEGTATFVNGVRSSVCPHMTWWFIALSVLGVVAVLLIIFGLGIFIRKTIAKRASKGRSRGAVEIADKPELGEELNDRDYEQDVHPDDPTSPHNEYARAGMAYQEPDAGHHMNDMLPPEPPRHDSMHAHLEQPFMEAPFYPDGTPGGTSRSMQALAPQLYSPTGHGIPGLTEPQNLLNLTQSALQQQHQLGAMTTAIHAPPVGHMQGSFAAPAMQSSFAGVGMHQQQMGMQSFNTMPPSSVQMGIGQMGGQQQYFTQRQRVG